MPLAQKVRKKQKCESKVEGLIPAFYSGFFTKPSKFMEKNNGFNNHMSGLWKTQRI
ncbi:hypothetical protein MTBBW1_340008 [Desulfamplus magnetovallimortis]|uniref:Uncharacterized protein n=1 Tax=Desulfamplus magnetovallimortis TaxID=1246637 RepID=A0A1W1HG88_9BACT|nr:hypothetical protein MTBBW1_340008 [Desulfamplus magnetovallimortis]